MAKDTEEVILEVARKHFVQNGYAATRMQDIADEAQINKAMLHYYFRSKEKLYKEILSKTLDTVIPIFAKALSAEVPFWQKVEKLVSTYITTLQTNPDIPFFIMSELSTGKESFINELKKRSRYFPAMQNFIVQMHNEMEAGNIRFVPPMHLMLNIMGLTIFPFMAKPMFCTVNNFSDEDFEHLMEQRKEVVMDFLRHALAV
jgi:AcrR family transcriptional regulator